MQLFKKLNKFYQFLISFLESALNFQPFPKKYEIHSSIISDIIDSENSYCLNALNAIFKDTLGHSMC